MNNISTELYQARNEIDKLQEQRTPLTKELQELNLKLAKLNNHVRASGRLPDLEYKGICKQQIKIKERIIQIQNSLAKITKEKREWDSYETELRAKIAIASSLVKTHEISTNDLFEKIKQLRNEYLDFAEDQSRINSMRIMASQFANELTKILSSV